MNDVFGRWGGKELISIADKRPAFVEGSCVDTGSAVVQVSAFFGVTHLQLGDTAAPVVHCADWLMHQSKENGRNRVTNDIEQ